MFLLFLVVDVISSLSHQTCDSEYNLHAEDFFYHNIYWVIVEFLRWNMTGKYDGD